MASKADMRYPLPMITDSPEKNEDTPSGPTKGPVYEVPRVRFVGNLSNLVAGSGQGCDGIEVDGAVVSGEC
jgi:hypothetical protein